MGRTPGSSPFPTALSPGGPRSKSSSGRPASSGMKFDDPECLARWWNMRDVKRIAIVDPNDTTREELRNVLLGMEDVWLEAECSRYEFFCDVIQQSTPDVVMISLDSDQNKALALITQLTADAPDLPIL